MQILTQSQSVQRILQMLARGPHVEQLGSKDTEPVSGYRVVESQALLSDPLS